MKIQTFFEKAGKGACLSLCYIKAVKPDATETEMFDILWQASQKGIIDANDDCYVRDAISLMKLANPKQYSVTKQNISSIQGIELGAVNFENNGYNHWVLVEKGQIIFDSLDDSKCVKYGKPTSARIISIIGE